jgi:hypothetical protein
MNFPTVSTKQSWPGRGTDVTNFNYEEMVLFNGEAVCPNCNRPLYIHWCAWMDEIRCFMCNAKFDGETALNICTSLRPAENVGDIEKAREAIRMKKQWLAQVQAQRPVRPKADMTDVAALLDEIATLEADQLWPHRW